MRDDGSTEELLTALRDLGSDHEPDPAAIRKRMDSRRVRRLRDVRPNGPRVLLSAAAAVTVLVGGVTAVARLNATDDGDARPSSSDGRLQPPVSTDSAPPAPASPVGQGRHTSTPTVSPSRTGTAASTPSAGATGEPTGAPASAARGQVGVPASVPPAPTPALPRSPESTPSTTSNVPAAIVVQAAPSTPGIDLGAPPLLDWVVVGARSDLRQVRAKSAATAPLLVVDQPGTATAVPGLFRTSWTGGLPEQSHVAATRWLSVDAATGISVTVAASSSDRTIVLYGGTGNGPATITTRTGGTVTGAATVPGGSAGPQAFVVTIRVPAAGASTQVTVRSDPGGPTSVIYLVAVALRAAP